jgi:hypothetical protein
MRPLTKMTHVLLQRLSSRNQGCRLPLPNHLPAHCQCLRKGRIRTIFMYALVASSMLAIVHLAALSPGQQGARQDILCGDLEESNTGLIEYMIGADAQMNTDDEDDAGTVWAAYIDWHKDGPARQTNHVFAVDGSE